MAYWLDYSAAKLDGQVIKAAGYTGVIRYIDRPNLLGWKHTTKAEYDSHRRAGLRVMLVMQTTTTASDGGHAIGVDHARRALAGAEYLGYGGPIFFTNDRTVVPNAAAWRAYLDGAASVLGKARTGAYGFRNAMDLARGHATYFWQAGRRSDVAGHTHIWQDNNTQVTVGGITCDRNLILIDPEEDDMPTPQELLNAKVERHGSVLGGTTSLGAVIAWYDAGLEKAAKRDAAIIAAVSAISLDPGIDETKLAQIVDTAVDAHTPSAEEVAAAQLPHIEAAVHAALDDDNADLAADIVRRIGESLVGNEEN